MATRIKNYEVDNRTGVNHEGATANNPIQRLTASSIIGDTVEDPEGEKLGKIENLMVNLQTGQIEYAVVDFNSFLGIGGKLFALPFTELKVNPNKEVFVLHRPKEYLKRSPGFDKLHWPDTNDHYYNYVQEYYRVPMGVI